MEEPSRTVVQFPCPLQSLASLVSSEVSQLTIAMFGVVNIYDLEPFIVYMANPCICMNLILLLLSSFLPLPIYHVLCSLVLSCLKLDWQLSRTGIMSSSVLVQHIAKGAPVLSGACRHSCNTKLQFCSLVASIAHLKCTCHGVVFLNSSSPSGHLGILLSGLVPTECHNWFFQLSLMTSQAILQAG